jgi:hypothetical protein
LLTVNSSSYGWSDISAFKLKVTAVLTSPLAERNCWRMRSSRNRMTRITRLRPAVVRLACDLRCVKRRCNIRLLVSALKIQCSGTVIELTDFLALILSERNRVKVFSL